MRIELALDHIGDIKRFDRRIDEITLQIHTAATDSGTTLTRIYGVGPVTAGLILGEVGDISGFPTRNHFASYTGTAPIAVSSGDINRHRLSRSGKPATQPRNPYRCHHPDPLRHPRPRLLPTQTRRRQEPDEKRSAA